MDRPLKETSMGSKSTPADVSPLFVLRSIRLLRLDALDRKCKSSLGPLVTSEVRLAEESLGRKLSDLEKFKLINSREPM